MAGSSERIFGNGMEINPHTNFAMVLFFQNYVSIALKICAKIT